MSRPYRPSVDSKNFRLQGIKTADAVHLGNSETGYSSSTRSVRLSFAVTPSDSGGLLPEWMDRAFRMQNIRSHVEEPVTGLRAL